MSNDLVCACPQCGIPASITDRFCEACGAGLAPVANGAADLGDRREIDAGSAAGLTNRGLVKRRNQDALYLEALPGRVVAVVCDGVSSSADAETAARVACTAAGLSLSRGHVAAAPESEMREAAGLAQRAVLSLTDEPAYSPSPSAPACTFVAAVWDGHMLTIGSIGDSRAYWIDDETAQRLTSDDSWAREQVDAGQMTPEEAESDPRAHQITHWIGAGAPDDAPTVTTFVPARPGRLAVCSDGLWNYAPAADELASWVRAVDDRAAIDVARALVDRAIAAGGSDNITVAVVDVVPPTKEMDS
jgi:serine/threonine protein phosphatase PrpC